MESDEYEYDSPSDPDEEACGYENKWNEVKKRLRINNRHVYIRLDENDDPSVLTELCNIVREGVSSEFLSYQLQIEQIHNAIISNPSKKQSNRVKDMRRLEELCNQSTEPILTLGDVHFLELPDARGFILPFDNLKFVTIGHPTKHIIDQLKHHPHLEYLTLSGNLPIFTMINGFNQLKLLTLRNITCSFQIIKLVCTNARLLYINIHVVEMQIPEFVAVLFKDQHVQCTNVTVLCGEEVVAYKEWHET